MRFAVNTTDSGRFSWWLYGGNNKMVAWAGEEFSSKSNAQRAAEEFKAGALTARYDVYLDAGAGWRWRAWRSSDKVASSGEAFNSKSDAERASINVRDNAGAGTGL